MNLEQGLVAKFDVFLGFLHSHGICISAICQLATLIIGAHLIQSALNNGSLFKQALLHRLKTRVANSNGIFLGQLVGESLFFETRRIIFLQINALPIT